MTTDQTTEAPPESKRCPACLEVKPLADYYRDSHKRNGRQSRCKSCKDEAKRLALVLRPTTPEQRAQQQVRNQRWYSINSELAAERGREIRKHPDWPEKQRTYNVTMYAKRVELRERFQDAKREMGCFFCDETEPVCLDMHHANPAEKVFSVSQHLSSRSVASLIAEAAKCVVLCANCHRKVHHGFLELPDDAARLYLDTFVIS